MKITFLVTGKTDQAYIREGIELYQKRMKHYISFERIEIPDIKNASSLNKEQIKDKEGELILKLIRPEDRMILLDERGEILSSIELSDKLRHFMNIGLKSIIFVVGGSYGFSKGVYDRADGKISLSKMTFPHQLIRLIWMEQLYRAFTIIKGEPYHHE